MCLMFCFFSIFFFKQKTAYEMRISDWSSDVCSSDLAAAVNGCGEAFDLGALRQQTDGERARSGAEEHRASDRATGREVSQARNDEAGSSEERRVGTECVSTCRSRWSAIH